MRSSVKTDRRAPLGILALLLTFVAPRLSVPAPGSPVSPKYPRYRMVVLGTLGGPNGGPFIPAVNLNDRGDVIAQADTTMSDPMNAFSDEGFITHSILSDATGIVRDLGALPGTNNSFPSGIA
jgi:hypothetical protein